VSRIGQPGEHRSGHQLVEGTVRGEPPAGGHASARGPLRGAGSVAGSARTVEVISLRVRKVAWIPVVVIRQLVVQRVVLGQGGGNDLVQDLFLADAAVIAAVVIVDGTQGICLVISAQPPETRGPVSFGRTTLTAWGTLTPRRSG
jgi:hypothetical protein